MPDGRSTTRRRLLQLLGTASVGSVAGCSEATGPATEPSPGDTPSPTRNPTATATETPTRTATETPRENPDTIFVSPDGADSNSGTRESPLETIQTAIDLAQPGETVFLEAGVHTAGDPERPVGITRRAGEPDNPITITGPPEAIVRGPPVDRSTKSIFHVTHSHIHIVGMTLDGLTVPDAIGDHTKYRQQIASCSPPTWQDSYPDYLTDVRIKPRAIGNARGKLVNAWRTNNLEIGEFEVIGPAGVDYYSGDNDGYVLGAVVSLGRSSNNFGTSHYPWEGPDESHNIHVHHIASLDRHAHTELVKLHAGNYDVTIEYCTDTGGNTRSGVFLPGAQTTVRWCELENGQRDGVSVFVPPMKENDSYEQFKQIPDDRFPGKNNSIHGNRLLDNERRAIAFSSPDWFDGGPDQQKIVCGNEFNGQTDGTPGESCPDSVPEGDGVGYLGGDSPWA